VDFRITRLFAAASLVLLFSTHLIADEPDLSLQKFARLSAEMINAERDVEESWDNQVPEWLDDILTRLPVVSSTESPDEESAPDVPLAGKESLPETDSQFPKPSEIPPLYVSPKLEGEGVWTADDLPSGSDGRSLVYKTVYRPSLEFPNSVVYMALFDMSRLRPRLFIGQTEPGIYQISHVPQNEDLSKIVAITNAMWMQQHSRGAGAIFRGQVVYPLVPGMATMVIYNDDSVDVLEWTDDIPLSTVKDARQLRYLIVKDGKVVDEVLKNGKTQEAEIGLGGFLIDTQGRSTMGNKVWYLANRTAFGIRDDGNLVFAMGHHVGTRDLARALVLAGCKRAIHGDANIHNIVCNFYFRGENNKILKRDRLSPEQLQYTMKRYDQGYAKDFFAFYEK
jgi:hypothetical protein